MFDEMFQKIAQIFSDFWHTKVHLEFMPFHIKQFAGSFHQS